MTWGSDITLYNTAVNALGKYIIAREANTPAKTLNDYKNTAQVAVNALATPLSGSIKLPKTYPSSV